jgi:hypothetical protein
MKNPSRLIGALKLYHKSCSFKVLLIEDNRIKYVKSFPFPNTINRKKEYYDFYFIQNVIKFSINK